LSDEAGARLIHDVYFKLVDASPEAVDRLLAACVEFLSGAEGVLRFATGTRVAEHARDVNDEDFDVSLHLVFESKAHHDAYQTAPDHGRFIEACSDNWATVRVHDTYVRSER